MRKSMVHTRNNPTLTSLLWNMELQRANMENSWPQTFLHNYYISMLLAPPLPCLSNAEYIRGENELLLFFVLKCIYAFAVAICHKRHRRGNTGTTFLGGFGFGIYTSKCFWRDKVKLEIELLKDTQSEPNKKTQQCSGSWHLHKSKKCFCVRIAEKNAIAVLVVNNYRLHMLNSETGDTFSSLCQEVARWWSLKEHLHKRTKILTIFSEWFSSTTRDASLK